MNVLLLGSGGREHVLAWKLAQSPLLQNLYIAPGNAGTVRCGHNVPVPVNDFAAIRDFVLDHSISMVVVGPEEPLVKGIHDFFLEHEQLRKIPVIGPVSKAAMLEGSKDFAKIFMNRHKIPTAAYQTFNKDSLDEGISFLNSSKAPFVLKADGLAAGKGVVICQDRESAIRELTFMIRDEKFGEASKNVVIEEFLSGTELSVFILTDGISYKILPEAKDYKKIGENDTGPNTGGMGAVSPIPFADAAFMEKVTSKIIRPTIDGLKSEHIDYSGFLFFGLINVKGEPFVIEYNCRMGDPEAEAVIPRINNDLLKLFSSIAQRRLEEEAIVINPDFTATVMLVSSGYPDKYEKGKIITGENDIQDSLVFHAGTTFDPPGTSVLTNGGRVLAVTSFGKTMKEALTRSNMNAGKIIFDGKYFRKDIGFDL